MSDSHTEYGRAPGMCPCSYTEVLRASRNSTPFLNRETTTSPWISVYGLSGWGLNEVAGCRLPVGGFMGCRVVELSGCLVTVVAGCRLSDPGAILCVGAGALAGPAAGGLKPAATRTAGGGCPPLTKVSFLSRDATAFDTKAQTAAAMIRVAASRKCFRQFIDVETLFAARMLRHSI